MSPICSLAIFCSIVTIPQKYASSMIICRVSKRMSAKLSQNIVPCFGQNMTTDTFVKRINNLLLQTGVVDQSTSL